MFKYLVGAPVKLADLILRTCFDRLLPAWLIRVNAWRRPNDEVWSPMCTRRSGVAGVYVCPPTEPRKYPDAAHPEDRCAATHLVQHCSIRRDAFLPIYTFAHSAPNRRIVQSTPAGSTIALSVCGNQFRVSDGIVQGRKHAHACPKCGTVVFSTKEVGRLQIQHTPMVILAAAIAGR